MRLRISARSSHLARAQAIEVGRALQEKICSKAAENQSASVLDLDIEYFFRESLGDKNLVDPLWKMPEKGVFTEDFYADLMKEKTDLVVHSWKDLPTERRADTFIYATLPRADQRDLLLFKKKSLKILAQSKKAVIFTSSQRRIYNLQIFLSQVLPSQPSLIEFKSVRGNVPTRLEKMMASDDVDGLVVAKAAIDRLLSFDHPDFSEVQSRIRYLLSECEFMVLPLSENPNAAAQGALAIEIKKSRTDLQGLLDQINDVNTIEAVQKERAVLAAYGGGCHQKIGIAFLPRQYGWIQFLKGETDQNEILNVKKILTTGDTPSLPQKKFSITQAPHLFAREEIPYVIPADISAIFVSRISSYRDFSGITWAAGIDTWKKLAAKNIWVHGCAESLGDLEQPRLESLVPNKLVWAKLTHQDAESSDLLAIPTYRLKQVIEWPAEMLSAENFFWMSAFHFDQAVAQFPAILSKVHCCGPGQTYRAIEKRLQALGTKPYIFISENDWRSHG